jgi:hypothetical protein
MNRVRLNDVEYYTGLYSSATTVADPVTCGEDLDVNLRLFSEIAPALCTDCGGYHLRYAVRRASVAMTPINFDRMELAQIIRARAGTAGEDGRVDIVIGGAADTGILATCAHAVAGLPLAKARMRYRVLDICESPLVLCRGYGRWHDLDVLTDIVDLRRPGVSFPADIIVLHSIFRQIPAEFHGSILGELGGWLKPGGCIVFSNRLHEPNRVDKGRRLEMLADRARRGDIKLSVTIEQLAGAFDERASQPHEFQNVDEIKGLFDQAGMTLESDLLIEKDRPLEDRASPETRYIAVLKRKF